MSLPEFFDFLLLDPASEAMAGYAPWYVAFNWVEAACWATFAGIVFVRYLLRRRSVIEPMYALAFLVFALSDVIETTGLTVMLLLLKATCLLALIAQRKIVVQLHPGWRF